MTIKNGQHDWGPRNLDGTATCKKCAVFCDCDRAVMDIEYFIVSPECTVHASIAGVTHTVRCAADPVEVPIFFGIPPLTAYNDRGTVRCVHDDNEAPCPEHHEVENPV